VPVWKGVENIAHTLLRSPDRPARSEPLHQMRYPGPHNKPGVGRPISLEMLLGYMSGSYFELTVHIYICVSVAAELCYPAVMAGRNF